MYHLILLWMIPIMMVIILVFFLSTFLKYFEYKSKVSLYLALNYLGWLGALGFFFIGHLSVFFTGEYAFYYVMTNIGNISVVIATIFIVFFHWEFIKMHRGFMYAVVAAGVALVIWMVLPFNFVSDPTATGFQIKYLTYVFMTIYCDAIFLSMAFLFLKTTRKDVQKKKELTFVGLGAMSFVIYFFIITIYGITQFTMILVISMFILITGLFFFFIGIYLPNLRKSNE